MTRWTDKQREVIESVSPAILVSASAGSGKTSVMVERIAGVLTSGKCAAENLLVVTFTRAAAAEMKERLAAKLDAKGETELKNSLPFAEIGTLHGFCGHFIRTFFYKAGLDPAFRICDEREAQVLQGLAATSALDAFQEREGERLSELTDLLSQKRGDGRILSIVRSLYGFAQVSPSPDEWLSGVLAPYSDSAEAELLAPLIQLAREYGAEYTRRKTEKGVLDYYDLERLTVRLLDDPEVAEYARNKYKYIFVDEYQDINPVQEDILGRIVSPRTVDGQDSGGTAMAAASGNNIFMVGDAKQSIYGFRACDPEIFIGKSQRADLYEVIHLNSNFRSRREILMFCNDLFAHVMTREFGGTDYAADSMFIAGATYPDSRDPAVRVVSVAHHTAAAEAAVIAREIERLMETLTVFEGGGERPARYGDIVILARSIVSGPKAVAAELAARGVPVQIKGSAAAADSALPLTEMLKLLDNFRQDIPLAAVMRSVLFRFTDAELAEIRRAAGREAAFCDAVTAFSEDGGGANAALSDKVRGMLTVIAEIRQACDTMTAAEILEYLIERFDYKCYMLGFSGGDLAVTALYERITRMRENNLTLQDFAAEGETYFTSGDESPEDDPDKVRITTIHSVKGKEYPAVILCNAGAAFASGRSPDTVFDRRLGAAVKLPKGKDEDDPVYRELITAQREKERREETRILYVALTRAKQRLIVTGALPGQKKGKGRGKDKDGTQKDMDEVTMPEPKDAASYMEWLLMGKSEYAEYIEMDGESVTGAIDPDAREVGLSTDFLYRQAFSESLSYRYPTEQLLDRPAKTTVTILNKENADARSLTAAKKSPGGQEYEYDYEPESRLLPDYQPDARADGNIYHEFFKNLDFNAADAAGEVARMVAAGLLTAEEAARLDARVLGKFLSGGVCARARAAKNTLRERRFIYRREGGGIIQGMADLIIIEEDGAVIYDYKVSRLPTATLALMYAEQLRLYALAVSEITGLRVKETRIYSVLSGEDIATPV